MTAKTNKLRRELRNAGLSDQAINAAWPSWWSEELADDPSGHAELRFALARRLGLSPRSLMGERVEFIWNDEARFKHLSTETQAHRAALSSFGVTLGRLLIRATPNGPSIEGLAAEDLRQAVLASLDYVDLSALLSTCWSLGIPVVHLRIFPLDTKAMHAMVVAVEGRFAILLGRDASYPAPVSFTLAHELGHIALRHLSGTPALVDMEDPARVPGTDEQEDEADQYAPALLTGRSTPLLETSEESFDAPTLAGAVLRAGPQYRIEPGILALCLAYQRGAWAIAMSALRFIYGGKEPVWRSVNSLAEHQLDWSALGDDGADWVQSVLGMHD